MKNKFLKVICATLALAMGVAAFSGCGAQKNYAENNTEFYIGATGPLTGDVSSYGISVDKGAKLAIKEINQNGGLNGVMFKYEMKDDTGDPTAAKNGYNQLYEAGMQISLGSVTSGACEAFAQKAKKNNVFFMTPSASAANVIENRSNAFRICFGDPDQGIKSADLLKDYSSVGVIYDKSDDYSSGIYSAFEQRMTELGKTSIYSGKVKTFTLETKTTFANEAANALYTCDAVFMPFYYTQAALAIKALKAKGFDGVVLGCDGFDGIEGQISASDNIDFTVKYITPFDAGSSAQNVSDFVNAYKAEYSNEVPDQFAADGYDAVYAIYEAMKAADVSDPTISPSDLCELVKTEIVGLTLNGVTGSTTWNAAGEPNKVPVIKEMSFGN